MKPETRFNPVRDALPVFPDFYLPPWKDPATEDPPRNAHEYWQAVSIWEESLEGGGLWDREQE